MSKVESLLVHMFMLRGKLLPFMSEQLRHAGEGPATALRVTDKRPLTCKQEIRSLFTAEQDV